MNRKLASISLTALMLLSACELAPIESTATSGPIAETSSAVEFAESGAKRFYQKVDGTTVHLEMTQSEQLRANTFDSLIRVYSDNVGYEWLNEALDNTEWYFYDKNERDITESFRAVAIGTRNPNGKYPVIVTAKYPGNMTLIHEMVHIADHLNLFDPQEIADYAPSVIEDAFLNEEWKFSSSQAREEMVADMFGANSSTITATTGAYTENLVVRKKVGDGLGREAVRKLQVEWLEQVVQLGLVK